MRLIKTSVLSFIATAIKMLAALAVNKAVAIYIGPTGLAFIGQFQNFIQVVMVAAQGGINSGVTKYSSEYGRESYLIPALYSTASKISLFSSVFVGVLIVLFSQFLSIEVLQTDEYSYVFVIFGFTIVLFVLNSLLLAMLNGLKDIKAWVTINIIQSVYSLIFTTLLIIWLGLDGALTALVTNQSIVLLIVLWKLRNHKVIRLESFKGAFDNSEAKKLLRFAVMALTSAIVVPISHIIIRNYIGGSLGWGSAGYWQAVWYISTMYLMIITMTLSVYYLPRLSEINDKATLRSELLTGYKIIMPIVILMALAIFLFKDIIIWVLFTPEFEPMRELFLWQLIGDVIKMAAWLLSYIMLAKAKAKSFILTEIIFSLTFVLLAVLCVDNYGLVGVTYAFALNYCLYLITVYFLVRDEFMDSKIFSNKIRK